MFGQVVFTLEVRTTEVTAVLDTGMFRLHMDVEVVKLVVPFLANFTLVRAGIQLELVHVVLVPSYVSLETESLAANTALVPPVLQMDRSYVGLQR